MKMISVRELAKTGNGKMLLLLWALTAIVLVAMPVLGSVHDEVAGNLAFGFCSALRCSIFLSLLHTKSEVRVSSLPKQDGLDGVVILGFALIALTDSRTAISRYFWDGLCSCTLSRLA